MTNGDQHGFHKRSPVGARGLAVVLLVLLAAFGGPRSAWASADDLAIKVLSNRADLISGGDALVQVLIPADVDPANVRVSVNGLDVTNLFAVRDDGRYIGLVDDLEVGDNALVAYVTSAPTAKLPARITIVNHPIGGPVFAGAQLLPWICAYRTATPVLVTVPNTNLSATATSRVSGLGSDPLDDQCNALPVFTFLYQPVEKQGTSCTFTPTGANSCFQAYDPQNPPPDSAIADFTNDRGDTVKSVIVVERGALNRAIYQLVTFFDPTKPHEPWAPQKGWNGKLHWRFGASASVSRFQSPPATSISLDMALRRGFMVASSSLTDHGTNSNDSLGAETMAMVKERIIENYGPIRYTMGDGCSGGSIMQQTISSAYPGLLDGIQPNCSFSDTLTTFIEIADCGILQNRYYTTTIGSALTTTQRAAINGHNNTGFCQAWISSFLNAGNPSVAGNCGSGFPASLVYNAATRGNGVRCDGADHDVGMLGTFVDTDGNTKANQPGDNVGVQYGLKALQAGVITPEDFVNLNEGVGSYNEDLVWSGLAHPGSPGSPSPRHAAAASTLHTVYSAGIVSDGRTLAKLPIIDLRGNQNPAGDIHMNWRAWETRDRLDRRYGDHGNQVIFAYTGGGGAGAVGAALSLKSFTTLDQWLANIEADTSSDPIETKVRNNKPADAHDLCLTTNGATDLTDVGLGTAACPVTFQSSPRQVAGGPRAEDVFKCTLKPLNFSDPDYTGITFSSDQQTRLQAVYPDGVCDWSKPGVMQVAADGGTTFEDGPGGKPLGPAPANTLGPPILTALNPAKVWIGLKNSDDVGAKFDLKAEVFNGDTLIGSGQLNGAPGGGSGFNNAKLNTIALNLTSPPQDLPDSALLSVRVSARVSCSAKGHASASARLWFNDAQAASGFAAMIDGVSTSYYLRTGSALGETQGQGPKSTIDVLLNSKSACPDRPFTTVGEWSTELD